MIGNAKKGQEIKEEVLTKEPDNLDLSMAMGIIVGAFSVLDCTMSVGRLAFFCPDHTSLGEVRSFCVTISVGGFMFLPTSVDAYTTLRGMKRLVVMMPP